MNLITEWRCRKRISELGNNSMILSMQMNKGEKILKK